MTKEQYRAIAKVLMRMKADIDNILEEDVRELSVHLEAETFTVHYEGNVHFVPIGDIDKVDIKDYDGSLIGIIMEDEF